MLPPPCVRTLFATGLILLGLRTQAAPLKIYILAGQSNMEGHAAISTFDYIAEDPTTAPLLNLMRGPDGKPRVSHNTWISYLTGDGDVKQGRLTVGYGALGSETKIGPEYTFGLAMEAAHKTPVLIIKTAWGGKSLNTDFRPPSAGPYQAPQKTLDMFAKHPGGHGVPKDLAQWKEDKKNASGKYYRLMMNHVASVLKDIPAVYPDYDPRQGFELSGFIWFQAWNDMCDRHTYPDSHTPEGYAEYTRLMAHFIRDVRKQLSAPTLPFVIGVIGVHGHESTGGIAQLRPAMAATAELKEFKGNVIAVDTADYWDEALEGIEKNRAKVRSMKYHLRIQHKEYPNKDGHMGQQEQQDYIQKYRAQLIRPEEDRLWERATSNAAYHYFGSAKIMGQIGLGFAKALQQGRAPDQAATQRPTDRLRPAQAQVGKSDESRVYTSRPKPKQEKFFGMVGATGIKLRLHKGLTLKVESILPGSPAEGKLQKGETIVGINKVALKDKNPYVILGRALTQAEASNGTMVFYVISADGKSKRKQVVNIPVLGAYSKTWPINCPKSKKIITQAAAFYADQSKFKEGGIPGALACLFLLSTGDDQYLPQVKAYFDNFPKQVDTIGDNT